LYFSPGFPWTGLGLSTFEVSENKLSIHGNSIASWFGWFMVFNTTFNNISVILWWLLMEKTGVLGEKH
jgi:hypothetical protein